MSRLKVFIALAVVSTAAITGNAYAWASVGVWVGEPVYYPYAPPPVVVQARCASRVYVERGQSSAAAAPDDGALAQQPGT